MAREKDEAKRQAIMAAAKRLFAVHGFHGASISDLAAETNLPVGSIYTYFDSKEDLIRAVINEGWSEFYEALKATLSPAPSAELRMALVIHRILPTLFDDVDLISILLLEGARYASLDEKLESLTGLIAGLVHDFASERGMPFELSHEAAKTALTLFLLGSLDTVRLSREAGLGIPKEAVVDFIVTVIEGAFHVKLSLPGPSSATAPASTPVPDGQV